MRHQFVEDTPRSAAACARGCCLKSRHFDECVDHETCWGCLPQRAANDLAVCERCEEKADKAIGRLPALVSWIRSQTEPGRGGEGPKVTTSKTPPTPTRLSAVDAADELHRALAVWCATVAYARRLPGPAYIETLTGLTGRHSPPTTHREHVMLLTPAPGAEGPTAQRVSRHLDRLDDKGTWQDDNARFVPVQATETAARWLSVHLRWALGQDWAGEFVEEILQTIRHAETRWSPVARPERAQADCFDCDRPLYRHSGDAGFGDEYVCSGCRKTYPYANYLKAVEARLQRERDRVIAQAQAEGAA